MTEEINVTDRHYGALKSGFGIVAIIAVIGGGQVLYGLANVLITTNEDEILPIWARIMFAVIFLFLIFIWWMALWSLIHFPRLILSMQVCEKKILIRTYLGKCIHVTPEDILQIETLSKYVPPWKFRISLSDKRAFWLNSMADNAAKGIERLNFITTIK